MCDFWQLSCVAPHTILRYDSDVESKNTALIIGTLIPFFMILLVAGSIYVPGIFIQPQYNFLYAKDPSAVGTYSVVNGKLEKKGDGINAPLFLYDVRSGESRAVTFDVASSVTLDARETSPDGFTITYGSRWRGTFLFFFFSGRDYTTRYLKGRNITKRVKVQLGEGDVFQFIGWVVK